MKQKTAVEWLYDQLMTTDVKDHVELLIKAKEMEKQQMKDAVLAQCSKSNKLKSIFEKQFDNYYSETFEK
jgi:hypothetical protein